MCTSRFYRHPKPLITMICLCMAVIILGLFKLFPKTAKRNHDDWNRLEGFLISGSLPSEVNSPLVASDTKCILPDLDAGHKGVMEYTKDLGKLVCGTESHGYLTGGRLYVKGNGIGSVEYEPVQERTSNGEENAQRFQLGEKVELRKSVVIQKLSKGDYDEN